MKQGLFFRALPVMALMLTLTACGPKVDPDTIAIHLLTLEGTGEAIGTVHIGTTPYGLLLTPDLRNLPPGLRGFHVHERPDCGPGEENGVRAPGLAAGGHYDPEGTNAHKGPYGDGHLGDLPALFVDENGRATHPVLAPRLSRADLRGRSLVIHAGGDNYADHPEPMGGGGARIACGIVRH